MARLAVVTPVFDDWECAHRLLDDLAATGVPFDVLIVDDGSPRTAPGSLAAPLRLGQVEVLRMGANVGHQRAIAAGLVHLAERGTHDAVVVMDADGEDRPGDIPSLLAASEEGGCIAVAQRRKRTDPVRFRALYGLYKVGFRALTGQPLDFGNFSVVPRPALERIVLMPELWNHYPATLMRSRLPLSRVPLDRGSRYHGRSRMRFTSLVSHGLAGISCYVDTAFARLLAASAFVMAGLLVVAGATVALRLATSAAAPGWLALGATAALIGVFQLIAALGVLSFLALSMRSSPSAPPTVTAPLFTVGVTEVRKADRHPGTDHGEASQSRSVDPPGMAQVRGDSHVASGSISQ